MNVELNTSHGFTKLEVTTKLEEREKVLNVMLENLNWHSQNFNFIDHLKHRCLSILNVDNYEWKREGRELQKIHAANSLFRGEESIDIIPPMVPVIFGGVFGLASSSFYPPLLGIAGGICLESLSLSVRYALLKLRDKKQIQECKHELLTIRDLKSHMSEKYNTDSVDLTTDLVKYFTDEDLKKLDLNQMFDLLVQDEDTFWRAYNNNLLNPEKEIIFGLYEISQMSLSELIEALPAVETKEVYEKNQNFIKWLIQLLPSDTLSDEELQKILLNIVENLKISATEIENIKLKIKGEEGPQEETTITFQMNNTEITVSKQLLSKNSSVFHEMLEETILDIPEEDTHTDHLFDNPKAFKDIVRSIEEKKELKITLENWEGLWDVANRWDFKNSKKSVELWVREHISEIIKKNSLEYVIEFCHSKDLIEILALLDNEYCYLIQRRAKSGNTHEYLQAYKEAVKYNFANTLVWLSSNYKQHFLKTLESSKPNPKDISKRSENSLSIKQKQDFATFLDQFLSNFEVVAEGERDGIIEKVLDFISTVSEAEKAQEKPKFLKVLYDLVIDKNNEAMKEVLSKFIELPQYDKYCKAVWLLKKPVFKKMI